MDFLYVYHACNSYNVTNMILVVYFPTMPQMYYMTCREMVLIWDLILLSYLSERGKLWTRTRYWTSLGLSPAGLARPSASCSVSGPWRETARLRRRDLLLPHCFLSDAPASQLSPPAAAAPPWPGFLPRSHRPFLQQHLKAVWIFSVLGTPAFHSSPAQKHRHPTPGLLAQSPSALGAPPMPPDSTGPASEACVPAPRGCSLGCQG